MTPEEYNERLTNLYGLVSGDLTADTIVPAAGGLLFDIKKRIAEEGRNSIGGSIGSYSSTPMYVTPQQFVNSGSFRAGGKPDAKGSKKVLTRNVKIADKSEYGRKFLPYLKERKGKNYTQLKRDFSDYKAMYLPEGYRELRDIQGLRTDIMNFTYRGDLLQSYQMQKIAQYVVLGLTTEQSALKRTGLEKRFGFVFYGTQQEQDKYISRVTSSMERITRGAFNSEGLSVQPIIESV